MVIIGFIFSGIVGCQFWTYSILGMKINTLLVLAFIVMWIPTVFTNIKNVKAKDPSKLKEAFGKVLILVVAWIYSVLAHFRRKSGHIERNGGTSFP